MPAIPAILRPESDIADARRQSGLRMMTWQAVVASGADGLASGGFLAAFALVLGASNLQIGVMTAVPFIVQPLQILVVALVERLRTRKLIAVPAYFVVYSVWIPIALIPFVIEVPSAGAVTALLFLIAIRGTANAFVNTSWNSWLRDVIPPAVRGQFLAQRMRKSTLAAALVGLGAALYIDYWKRTAPPDDIVYGYSFAMLFGSMALGWAAVAFMSRIPEPRMPDPEGPRRPLVKTLGTPLGDANFRQLMKFLFLWNFATHMAVPFFTVYMLRRLELPLTMVVGFAVLGQLFAVLFRLWGPLVDQFGSKVVLSLSASLYLLVIIGWSFTTMPERYFLTVPLLITLHIFAGIATAGINLASMTLRMKLAPEAHTTSYMTGASLAVNLGAGISPLLGGFFADFFSVRQFQVSVSWLSPSESLQFPAIFLTGYDFLFAVAFMLGLITLNVLASVREEGEANREVVMDELRAQTRDNLRVVTGMPVIGLMSHIPHGYLRRVPVVPGLDIALGVAAYQLAATTRDAVSAASRSGATAVEVANRVSRVIGGATGQLGRFGSRYGIELAKQATRGALHAVDAVAGDVRSVARGAVRGSLRALARSTDDPLAVLWGVGYGTVQGADESGADLAEAAAHAVAEVKEAAQELGIPEDEAAAQFARGAVEAAETLGPDAASRVKGALLEQLLDIALPGQPDGHATHADDATESPSAPRPE